MADKKLSFTDVIFLILIILFCAAISGCSSAPKVEAVAPKVYYCPNEHAIPLGNIKTDIREINICPTFGAKFPYLGESRGETYSDSGGQNYKPKIYGPSSSYYSDVNYQRFGVGGYSFKETSYGFSELSWYFHDSKVKSHRIIPHWTRRYHYQ